MTLSSRLFMIICFLLCVNSVSCKTVGSESNLQSRYSSTVGRGEYPYVAKISVSGKLLVPPPPRPSVSGKMEKPTTPETPTAATTEFKTFDCSGTLICPNVVLTAAHCFDGFASLSSIQIDLPNAKRHGVQTLIASKGRDLFEAIRIPKDYRIGGKVGGTRFNFDLALIHLDSNFPGAAVMGPERIFVDTLRPPMLKANIQPKIFPPNGTEDYEYETVFALGYGATEVDEGDDSVRRADMRFSRMERQLLDPVSEAFPLIQVIPGPKDQLICVGDSGGPLLVQRDDAEVQLVAVTSATVVPGYRRILAKSSCTAATGAYFVPLAFHREWLAAELKDICSSLE